MTAILSMRRKLALAWPFQMLPALDQHARAATYADADPALIRAAVARAQRRPGGNWFALVASSSISDAPVAVSVASRDLVAWRGDRGRLLVAPRACPHLGADLTRAVVRDGCLVCPWHGLELSQQRHGAWRPLPSHDDGVLCWVRLDDTGTPHPTELPVATPRPAEPSLSAVARAVGVCEPRDIVANRCDPWHGAWFHPYSFTRLRVLSAPPADDDLPDDQDRFVVAVTFRIGRLGVPVIAEFTAPAPRTVVMRIIEGEGCGSVVETHATPLGDGGDGRPRSAVVEAIVAHSDRPHFGKALVAAPVIRPLIRRSAGRLWRDDMAYAERLFELRS